MVTMPEVLIGMIREWHTVPVATAGLDGRPNIAPKSVLVRDPETIVWGELYRMQTYENLLHNPVASISVWKKNPPFTAFRMQGKVEIHEHDETRSPDGQTGLDWTSKGFRNPDGAYGGGDLYRCGNI